jgi:Family of unknown function (DUF6496)
LHTEVDHLVATFARWQRSNAAEVISMAATKKSGTKRKYGAKAASKVKRAMHKRKHGTLTSGRSKKKVKSRKQAIAIGLSEARAAGGKVPKKKPAKKKK